MDQVKIGGFISRKRKEKNITQSALAEMLGITDRAVSKWENGICMPDVGKIPELCGILGITVNDLFSGEVIDMKNNEKLLEQNLIEMTELKQKNDKRLLLSEIFIGFLVSVIMMACVFTASFVNMGNVYRVLLIVAGMIQFAAGLGFCLRIEQKAGYYECEKCKHRYVPAYSSVLWSMHFNRTRYMRCPKCHKYSWNKKVISGGNEND